MVRVSVGVLLLGTAVTYFLIGSVPHYTYHYSQYQIFAAYSLLCFCAEQSICMWLNGESRLNVDTQLSLVSATQCTACDIRPIVMGHQPRCADAQ